jgi:hypothetical protein
MELAEFELSRTFLETFCAPHNKRLGIPMMKENCKKKIILSVIFVQTAHILTDICQRHNL